MKDVESLLPHRPPFLFVDRLERADEKEIIGFRQFKPTEHYFQGHFPEYPVVPGVLLVECLAQCGGAGVAATGVLGDKLVFLAAIEKAKFRRQVKPGDEIKMVVHNLRISPRMLRQKGTASVGDDIVCEAEWLCLVGDRV